MSIRNLRELTRAKDNLARLEIEREMCAGERTWTAAKRAAAVEEVQAQIRKVEQEIQSYTSAESEPE